MASFELEFERVLGDETHLYRVNIRKTGMTLAQFIDEVLEDPQYANGSVEVVGKDGRPVYSLTFQNWVAKTDDIPENIKAKEIRRGTAEGGWGSRICYEFGGLVEDQPTRGGARPGAGRPKTQEPRQNMTLSVSPKTLQRARTLRSAGVKVNQLVERVIAEAYEQRILVQKFRGL